MKKSYLVFCVFLSQLNLSFIICEDFSLYIKDRLISPNLREHTFLEALKLLSKYDVKTIVETGTARAGARGFDGDGGSSIIFGHWASLHNAHMYSVDIDLGALKNARSACKKYLACMDFVCNDSVEYLKKFDKQIDFLYLDSFDFDSNDPKPSQQHHLNEIKAAYDKLTDNSIIMIDDCGEWLNEGGKGGLVIPWLLDHGWKVYIREYQAILLKN